MACRGMVRALLVKCEKGKLRNFTIYDKKPSEYWQLLICYTLWIICDSCYCSCLKYCGKLSGASFSVFVFISKVQTPWETPRSKGKWLTNGYRDINYLCPLDNKLASNACPPQLCSVWFYTTGDRLISVWQNPHVGSLDTPQHSSSTRRLLMYRRSVTI